MFEGGSEFFMLKNGPILPYNFSQIDEFFLGSSGTTIRNAHNNQLYAHDKKTGKCFTFECNYNGVDLRAAYAEYFCVITDKVYLMKEEPAYYA